MKRYLVPIVMCFGIVAVAAAQETGPTPEVTLEVTPEVTPDVNVTAQVAKAWFSVPRDTYLVGERIPLKLTLQMPVEGVDLITWPEFPVDWPPFEILSNSEITETVVGDIRQFEQDMTVVVWYPGTHVPSDTFIAYQIEGEEIYNLPVLPVTVTVPTVLDGVNFDLRPFKPPIALFFLSPLIVFFGGVGLVYGTRRWRKYRSRPKPLPQTILTPVQLAVQQLFTLSSKKLPPAILYMQVADCVRSYINGRFEIPAQDMTTAELLTTLEIQLEFPERLQRELHHLLEHADLVKFARAQPSVSVSQRLLTVARGWFERVEAAYSAVSEEESA